MFNDICVYNTSHLPFAIWTGPLTNTSHYTLHNGPNTLQHLDINEELSIDSLSQGPLSQDVFQDDIDVSAYGKWPDLTLRPI